MTRRLWFLASCAALAACDSQAGTPTPPKGTPAASSTIASTARAAKEDTATQAPVTPFTFEPWKSPRKDIAPISPPESLLEPWRVIVNQLRPRQRKNPKWTTLPPKESVELDMAQDGRFRCIVNPLRIDAKPNDELSEVEAWVLSRDLLCSADGWHTWTTSMHRALVGADGAVTKPEPQAEAVLRERIGGKIRETVVILRSDKDTNTTRKGPPQLIDAPQHVD